MHAFPKLLSPFQGPSQFAALLPQSDKAFQYHNEYRMLRSFVRTLPFEFHQLLVWRQKDPENFDDPVYIVNRGFFLPRLIRPPGDMPSKFSLLFTWHITNVQNDIFTTKYLKLIDTHRHFDYPSNPCAANWFPCFKETRHHACFRPQILLLSVPDCRFI